MAEIAALLTGHGVATAHVAGHQHELHALGPWCPHVPLHRFICQAKGPAARHSLILHALSFLCYCQGVTCTPRDWATSMPRSFFRPILAPHSSSSTAHMPMLRASRRARALARVSARRAK